MYSNRVLRWARYSKFQKRPLIRLRTGTGSWYYGTATEYYQEEAITKLLIQ